VRAVTQRERITEGIVGEIGSGVVSGDAHPDSSRHHPVREGYAGSGSSPASHTNFQIRESAVDAVTQTADPIRLGG
jgi:hypothetical protein